MKRFSFIMVMLAVVMCFAACSESSSGSDSSKQTTGITEVSTDGKLLTFGYQPGGEMTKEQFESGRANYTVYADGRVVNDKNGEEKTLESDEFEKLKEYAEMVINNKVDVIERDGADMPSYSVTVYETDGKTHRLTSNSGGEIVGFNEVYKLVREKFTQK